MTAVTLAILLVVISVFDISVPLFSPESRRRSSQLKPHQLRRCRQITSALRNSWHAFPGKFRGHFPECASPGRRSNKCTPCRIVPLFLWEGPLAERIPEWAAGFAIFELLC